MSMNNPNAIYAMNEERNFDFVTSVLNNSSLNEESKCGTVDKRKVTLAEVIACAISILTVAENFVILIAITKGPTSLRKPPYWFIASLAAADLLTGIEVILAIFVPVGTSPLSRVVLKGLAVVTFIVSINSLLLVSFDRFLRIARRVEYERLLTQKTIIFLIAVSWLLSIVVFLVAPLLGLWSCAAQHCCADDGLCVCRRSELGGSARCDQCSQSFVPFSKKYLIIGTAYFFIAIVLMVGFYMALFRVVKKKTFGHNRGYSKGDHSKPKKREIQLAKTLIITLGIFVICWLPVVVLFIVDIIITKPNKQLTKIFDYALVPSVINSLLNPIIYSIKLPRMRNTVKHITLPCIYGGSENGFYGSAWTTHTSFDRSMRASSVQKRIAKLRGAQGACSSNSGSGKSTNSGHARSQIVSAKSFTSEGSLSNGLSHPSKPTANNASS